MSDIYWMCKDYEFYKEGIKILKERNVYDHKFWSFSILHKDLKRIKEFFSSDESTLK